VGLEAGPARRLRGRPRAGLGRGGAKPLLFYKYATSSHPDPPSSFIISSIAKTHLFGNLEGLMLKLKLLILWPPDAKNRLVGKDPDERLKAGGEGDDRG